MIPFSEKLTFLMHITETSNKELAAELGVDPSMISLMRTGRRKLSKNPAHLKKMSAYFARRCSAAFQRQALSEMLDQVSISPSMPTETLSYCLEVWLQGGSFITDTFFAGIRETSVAAEEAAVAIPVSAGEGRTVFFYGEEGRQEAMYHVLQTIRTLSAPTPILTVVDDNLEWLLSNYPMSKQVQRWLLEAAERGFTFVQIMPPLNYINRYAESLHFWMPMYATGSTKVYYYPRLRGNLYRHSMIVVPGCCVQYACAVAAGSTSDITMFSTDPQLVAALEKQFHEHLVLCRPALTAHRDTREIQACYRNYSGCRGDFVQMINSLSISTMPRELLERYVRESEGTGWNGLFRMCLENIPDFEKRLTNSRLLDAGRLFTAEEIRAGRVAVGSVSQGEMGQCWYTPETYCLHLRNILRLLDTYENYTFLPMEEKEYPDYDLLTNEEGFALISRTAKPMMTMEIRRPAMVDAFREYILRKADAVGYEGIHREKARMALRSLLQELDG